MKDFDSCFNFVILCREVDKHSNRGMVVYTVYDSAIDGIDKTPSLLNLRLRSTYNPELQYFIVTKSNYEQNKDVIEKRLLNLEKYNEFCEAVGDNESLNDFLVEDGILLI